MSLKEFTDWESFVKDLAIEIIEEAREHQGKPMDAIKDIAKALVSEKLRGELTEAIKGSTLIPSEIKDATAGDWFEFVTNVITQVPEFIDAFTGTVTPAIPEIPATPTTEV